MVQHLKKFLNIYNNLDSNMSNMYLVNHLKKFMNIYNNLDSNMYLVNHLLVIKTRQRLILTDFLSLTVYLSENSKHVDNDVKLIGFSSFIKNNI